MKLRYLIILKVALLICLWLPAFFIWPKIVLAEIIINEIMYDLPSPGADDKREWIELYNSGQLPIDLTGWKFNDGANHVLNLPPEKGSRGSLIIDANGYLLLASDATTLAGNLPSYTGAIIDTVMSLNNTSAQLKMLNKDNIEMASTSYSNTMGATGNGKTLEWNGTTFKEGLIDGGTPGLANSILSPASFQSSTPTPSPSNSPAPASNNETISSASPTPTPTPYQYSQDILINEFLPWPANETKEWVELFNNGSETVNLYGWQIDDADNSTSPQVIPANTAIVANDFLVITFNKSTFNNDGDKVRLLWPDDQVIHVVEYNKASQGQSVARFNNNWFWTNQPTPGQANKKSALSQPLSFSAAGAADATDATPPTIAALQESVTEQKPSSNQKTAASPAFNASPSPPASTSGSGEKQLAASTAQPLSKSSRPKTILSLIGVLSVAALAALFLIRLRRRASIDND